MSDTALHLEGLTKIYRRSHLGRVRLTIGVSGIALDVKSGEIFGLLGLNGSGKTTTIKLILGLLRPTRGSVRVFGKSPGSPGMPDSVGYLPEFPYFYPYLSSPEILRFYGRLSGVSPESLEERIAQTLRTVRLSSCRDRRISEFSKGMLQRLGIAQAILHQPSLIVLDEPVSGLDPLAVREMRNLILDLNRGGSTLFFSSHSISEVERLCHRAAILVGGNLARIVEQSEWKSEPGKLEGIFVETVQASSDV